jgi:hypothetical protein
VKPTAGKKTTHLLTIFKKLSQLELIRMVISVSALKPEHVPGASFLQVLFQLQYVFFQAENQPEKGLLLLVRTLFNAAVNDNISILTIAKLKKAGSDVPALLAYN